MDKKKSAFDAYLTAVYKWGIITLVSAALCAASLYTFMNVIGLIKVSWTALIIFDIMDVLYFIFAIFLVKTSIEDGYLKEGRLQIGKLFAASVVVIQWNYIIYMVPSRTFWSFLFFFIILVGFFLDLKLVLVDGILCVISLVISWFVIGNNLPVKDELFISDLIMCIVGIVLSIVGISLFIFFMTHFLVNAKKDELEANNKRVHNILTAAKGVSENLLSAGVTLSQIADSESASSEQLSATSDALLQNSNLLSEKSDESVSNLNELRKWGAEVNETVEKVEKTSLELLGKSEENEKLIDSLQQINEAVVTSTNETSIVAEKLSHAVQEIGGTLQLINDISESTNLLALNASIEAARAGEAGRGFAVVAVEVGNLANSTKDSLNDVQDVINRVQENVLEMTNFVENNSQKLAIQNESFVKLFSGLHEMIVLLHQSINDIKQMGTAHSKQAEVIQSTITISEDIATSIRQENAEFSNISTMVENDITNIDQMIEQVTAINLMTDEIGKLLNA